MYCLLFWHRKCFSALAETTIVKHKSRSWREVWTQSSVPKRVLPWVVAHLPFHIMHKVPGLRGAYIIIITLSWRGELYRGSSILFLDMLCGGWQKIGPNGIHSHMQRMKWNDGLSLAAHQCKEAWQSYRSASAGWLQLFPRGSAPKWRKIALKMAF